MIFPSGGPLKEPCVRTRTRLLASFSRWIITMQDANLVSARFIHLAVLPTFSANIIAVSSQGSCGVSSSMAIYHNPTRYSARWTKAPVEFVTTGSPVPLGISASVIFSSLFFLVCRSVLLSSIFYSFFK